MGHALQTNFDPISPKCSREFEFSSWLSMLQEHDPRFRNFLSRQHYGYEHYLRRAFLCFRALKNPLTLNDQAIVLRQVKPAVLKKLLMSEVSI